MIPGSTWVTRESWDTWTAGWGGVGDYPGMIGYKGIPGYLDSGGGGGGIPVSILGMYLGYKGILGYLDKGGGGGGGG